MASYVDFDRVGADQSREDNQSGDESYAAKGLPENQDYTDTGCEIASSCLRCPLAMCKYDDPNWKGRSRNLLRDQEIVRLRSKGLRVADIAKICNTSDRTVYRVIQRDLAPEEGVLKRVSSVRPRRRSGAQNIPMEQLAVWQQYSMGEMTGVQAA